MSEKEQWETEEGTSNKEQSADIVETNEQADNNLENETAEQESAVAAAPSHKGSNKIWMGISIILAAALIIVILTKFTGGNETVATVNGTKITKDDFYKELVKAGGAKTLDNMITQELVKQEADKAGIKVTEDDINKELAKMKEGFGSDEEFKQAIENYYGMTYDQFKDQMKFQVEVRKLLEPQVKVTDDQIKQYYEQNKASYNTPEQVKASHILVKTEAEAKQILQQLKSGADFATLAKEKSIDPGSKDKGGELGYFSRGDMVKEFEDAAFSTKVGEISGIVKSEHGYHIIKVEDHKPAHTATLEEKKAEIKDTLISQEVSNKYNTWIEQLKAKADISNTLESANKDAAKATTDATTTK
ncbi:peptidylprolyl isomerase [Paenibacillus sediminis]|uniref:Foldase protein PrsA n=1 Tax=Paenibacillus sediminis TaxID=664909 RepID=A0ABS4H188_9BACL|nr:peptidylprolyl isomerase [Paenibacillus sediminis]MBP1936275.1 foldase protein PrsA [Paenibacillus sediminis]